MVAINFTCSLLLSSIHYAVRRSHYHGYFIINIISRKEVYCEVNVPARARRPPPTSQLEIEEPTRDTHSTPHSTHIYTHTVTQKLQKNLYQYLR